MLSKTDRFLLVELIQAATEDITWATKKENTRLKKILAILKEEC